MSDSGVRSRGLTLATTRGAAVIAPAAGVVKYAGPFRDYDGIIIIDHGGGWASLIVNVGTRFVRVTASRSATRSAGRSARCKSNCPIMVVESRLLSSQVHLKTCQSHAKRAKSPSFQRLPPHRTRTL